MQLTEVRVKRRLAPIPNRNHPLLARIGLSATMAEVFNQRTLTASSKPEACDLARRLRLNLRPRAVLDMASSMA